VQQFNQTNSVDGDHGLTRHRGTTPPVAVLRFIAMLALAALGASACSAASQSRTAASPEPHRTLVATPADMPSPEASIDPDQSGPDYVVTVSATNEELDSHSVQMFVVSLNKVATRARVDEIAAGFRVRHAVGPTVVYVVPGSDGSDQTGSFGPFPDPITAANLADVPNPPYRSWILVSASIPSTAPLERWGPGASELAVRLVEPRRIDVVG
jgi:hypothetical protein